MMNYDTLIQDRRSWFITCIIKKTYGLGSWHPCHHFKLNPVAIPPAYRYNLSYLISLYVPLVTRGMASILSEVMMYVSIIGLQLWLVIEMIYCYRKIAAAGEEALRESAWVTLKTQTHTHTHTASLFPLPVLTSEDRAGPSKCPDFPPTAFTVCYNLLLSKQQIFSYFLAALTSCPDSDSLTLTGCFPFSPFYHSLSFRAEYLAIASESKDNCAGEQAAE